MRNPTQGKATGQTGKFGEPGANHHKSTLVSAVALALAMASTACGQEVPRPSQHDAAVFAEDEPILLGIDGFNYTDLVIDYFSVVSQGGGNILVSSPTSGGSGTVCCVTWYHDIKLPIPMEVEWMRYSAGVERWCKRTVTFKGPVPSRPSALGVHFMPDGDIEIEITKQMGELKLSLQRFSPGKRKEAGNVVYDDKFASCTEVKRFP